MYPEYEKLDLAIKELLVASAGLDQVMPQKDFTFEEEIKKIQRFSKYLALVFNFADKKIVPFSDFPNSIANIKKLQVVCAAIINFSVLAGNVQERVDELKREVSIKINETRKSFTPFAAETAYDVFSSELLSQKSEELTKNANRLIAEINVIHKDAAAKNDEIARALNAAKMASGAQGISSYADLYHQDKKRHNLASWIWLSLAAIFALGTVAFSGYGFFRFEDLIKEKTDIDTLIQFTLSKFLFTGVLILVTLWLARMFKIEKNLSFINRQKENALQTFRAFHSAANEDVGIKNAILMETTRSIFSANNSGLIGNDSNDEVTKVIEIVKSFTSKE